MAVPFTPKALLTKRLSSFTPNICPSFMKACPLSETYEWSSGELLAYFGLPSILVLARWLTEISPCAAS